MQEPVAEYPIQEKRLAASADASNNFHLPVSTATNQFLKIPFSLYDVHAKGYLAQDYTFLLTE